MKRILSIIMLSFLISYSGRAQSPACDSISSIISCGAVDSAVSLLDSYYIGGVDSSVSYSLPFTENYLGLYFSNVNLQQYAWSDVLQCCIPPRVNFSDTIASHCDTTEFVYLSLLYSQIPTDTCIPYWVYNVLLRQNVPWFADSTVFLLCSDLSTCKLGCFNYCNDTLRTACDSFNSLYYTYHQFLRGEGLTIDTALLDNIFYALYAQPLSYAQIVSSTMNCNTDTAVLTEITYSARNLSYSSSAGQYYMDFDVFATDTPANLLFSQSNVFIQYDSTIFGTNLVNSGRITASKGQAVDSPYYNLALTDSTSNMLKISITHTPNPNSLANLDSVNQQLCHLRINLTGFNLTSVAAAFDTIAMAGRSEYQETTSGLEFPYDIVRVSGLVGATQSTVLAFSLLNPNLSPSTNPTQLDFDLVGTQTVNDPIADYTAVINYNAIAFDSAYVSNYLGMGDDGMGNAIYNFNYNFSSGILTISFTANTLYDATLGQTNDTITTFNNLAHVTLFVNRCGNLPNVVIDKSNCSADYGDANTTSLSPLTIDTSQGDFNNSGTPMCPYRPSVTAISPYCVGAGSMDVLTITGDHFGTDTGYVYFTNADSSGSYTHTQLQDIRLWTDNEIDLLIPSYPGTAASGVFYVQTAAGLDNSADSNLISIPYANINKRNGDNSAEYVFLRDTPFVFQLDTTLFYTPGVIRTVQHVLADMNCQTGVNFQLDTTGPSAATQPLPLDHINLISLQQPTSGYFPNPAVDLAVTPILSRTQSCASNLPQYNNYSAYRFDLDISIVNVPPRGSWLWTDSILPTTSQVDFATVLIHELGHGAGLGHTLPVTRAAGNVMNPGTPIGVATRTYDNDPNDILGIKHALALGLTIGTAGGCPYATPVFPSGCPTVNPSTCVLSYPHLGIEDIHTGTSFDASLYPNPYQGTTVIHIDVSQYTEFTITIYDLVGHLISQIRVAGGTSFDVPLSDFHESMGMYLIQVSDSQTRKIFKLIKL